MILVQFEGDRLRLPPRFAQQAGLNGTQPVPCWLLLVNPWRYRLLKQAENPPQALSTILERLEESAEPGDVLDATETDGQAALPLRLIPCVISPKGPGWRLNVPREVRALASQSGAEASQAFFVISSGFVELWFPDALRKAMVVPLPDLLP